MDLQTARAGPRGDAETGSRNVAMLGSLHIPSTAASEARQVNLAWSPADWRLAKGGLSECEMALLDCFPVVCDTNWYARLWGLGIRGAAGLHVESVVFLPGGQFEFWRNLRDATGAVVALIIPALDGFGEIEDLMAFDIDGGAVARWRGCAAVLGGADLGWVTLYGCSPARELG